MNYLIGNWKFSNAFGFVIDLAATAAISAKVGGFFPLFGFIINWPLH